MSSDPYYRSALTKINERNSGSAPPPAPAKVNTTGRIVSNVPEPAARTPSEDEFFAIDDTGDRKPNPTFLKQHFFREGRLTDEQALYILQRTTHVLSKEANMVHVKSPVTICGDIHGQYYDLMKLFDVGGPLTDNSYLFLGDYVDRGCFGIECLLYLYALKLWYPGKFVLLRGNHECRHLTEYFTFKRECLHKYSPEVYEACIASFNALPLAALVDGRFFCVHGGISPELVTLDDIRAINRFEEPGSHGLLCDLLWSDPISDFGHEQERGVPQGTTFLNNATRGCSYYFTYEAACQFLERNNLLGIIRGHEAQDAGYTMHRKTPTKKFPSVITIFSAPNYLDVYHNRGAILKYANKNITIRQYNSSQHPYWLPNFMDAFTWSLPFVGAKITEMLLAILSICSEEELNESDESEEEEVVRPSEEEIQQRRQVIKNKILAVGRMQRVFQLLREESENASELVPTGAPSGSASVAARNGPDALGVQGYQIRRQIHSFADARRSDIANERLPTRVDSSSPVSPTFPPPSMRRGSEDGINMEMLIKKTLSEDVDDGGYVQRIADTIAKERPPVGRPRALKRFETT
ncbi:hypothetical protein EYR40_002095 [Pleurotus pulmonarius]|nr:hypothetical protein EYR36_011504 [Pleurotus pulmonarius]KAF4585258.1 hypothetical protein EYR40_002095 [Pleurotus pulmonarius]